MIDNDRFSELLAIRLASGSTIRDACAEIGCSEPTGYRLAKSPEFRQRVSEIRSEITSQAVGKLTQAANHAADALVALLDDQFDPSVRLQAAKAILNALGPLSELGELRARLNRIEGLYAT